MKQIVGHSAALCETLKQLESAARTDCTVLISGETGTGKELIARAVHESSARAAAPFVRLNCAAIPSGLFESELFGHERGAFTGAVGRKPGRFELAEDGTLLLDEVGELPLQLQPKLLRALQEREFERVGGVRTLCSNARVVATTNRDLAALCEAGEYREDLYYRLHVFPVRVPPLRERREDIPLLTDYFLQRCSRRLEKDLRAVSNAAMSTLLRHDWPGNVRELEHVLERAAILAAGPVLEVELIPVPRKSAELIGPHSEVLDEVNRRHILSILSRTNGVIGGPQGAAARLGMKRSTLNFRLKKLGIPRGHGRLQGPGDAESDRAERRVRAWQ